MIEASRPRALAQFGLDAVDIVTANGGPQIWVSITGYGRNGEGANRVAFGDDAAVAGGLVTWADDVRFSALMPSPTRSLVWRRRAPASTASARAGVGSSTSPWRP